MSKKIKINKKKAQLSSEDSCIVNDTKYDINSNKDDILELQKKKFQDDLHSYHLDSIKEFDESVSDISDEIDFEEEVRKLIGIRNTTQSPQYTPSSISSKVKKDIVIEFPDSLPNKSSFVATDNSTCKGSFPVSRRNSGTPSSR